MKNDASIILKRAGLALIIFGVVDICFMIYCILKGIGYASSFNIFAVIAGIYIYRGNVKTILFARFFLKLFIGAIIVVSLLLLFIIPIGLITAYMQIYTAQAVLSISASVAITMFLIWVVNLLDADSVSDMIAGKGSNTKSIWHRKATGYVVGSVLVLILGLLISIMSMGDTSKRAVMEAKRITGQGYNYYVTSISTSHSSGKVVHNASVTAYNSHEIKDVDVEWSN